MIVEFTKFFYKISVNWSFFKGERGMIMKFTNLFVSFTNIIYFPISQNDIDTKCWLLSCNYIKVFSEENIYNCYYKEQNIILCTNSTNCAKELIGKSRKLHMYISLTICKCNYLFNDGHKHALRNVLNLKYITIQSIITHKSVYTHHFKSIYRQ